jgi:hypothetical protein
VNDLCPSKNLSQIKAFSLPESLRGDAFQSNSTARLNDGKENVITKHINHQIKFKYSNFQKSSFSSCLLCIAGIIGGDAFYKATAKHSGAIYDIYTRRNHQKRSIKFKSGSSSNFVYYSKQKGYAGYHSNNQKPLCE